MAAVRHFRVTTGRYAHPFNCVIGVDARGVVVRVCYGWSKPPNRNWYLVGSNGKVIAELTAEEVDRCGEPAWL